jgi:hypothetical protein
MHIADNHEALLDYLYEEGDPAERLKIARHLQECATCSVAVLEFQSVRGMLRSWTPPAAELGFRVVQDRELVSTERTESGGSGGWSPGRLWQWQGMRAWSQAAAAILLFVAGMGVSQLDFEYADGSLTVGMRNAEPQPRRNESIVLTAAPSSPAETVLSPQALSDLERILRARLAASSSDSGDTEQLLQRVRSMIDQSEQRQERELALRLSQVAQEVNTQHQADLLRIQQNVGQTQDLMEYLVRTSGGVK